MYNYIESQFDRCLDQLFGIVLSPADDAKLMEKYGSADPKRKGMVSYRRFCEVIGAGLFRHYAGFNFKLAIRCTMAVI